MIFNLYKKYYSPNGDPSYSGEGGEEGGGEEGGRDYGGGTGNGTGGGAGNGTEGGGRSDGEREYFDIFNKEADDARAVVDDTRRKKIIHFDTNLGRRDIDGDGETRRVTIKGTPASVFTVTVKDSSGCSMLVAEIENKVMPSKGSYTFTIKFPSISASGTSTKTKETYDFTITPAADVRLIVDDKFTLKQIANPVITITKSTSQTGPALSVSGSDITITGPAMQYVDDNVTKTYTLTITGSDGATAESLYVKPHTIFADCVSTNTVIKKIVANDNSSEKNMSNELVLKGSTTRTDSSIEGEDSTTGDLVVGMVLKAVVREDKVVVGNLDDDGNIIDYNACKTLTKKLKLTSTSGIFTNMKMIGSNLRRGTRIASIDCDQTITIVPPQIVRKDTAIRFERRYNAVVSKIVNTNAQDETRITLNKAIPYIPKGTEVEFDDNTNAVLGINRFNTSGADSITLTSYIKPRRFGDKNVTYTLDLDKLITSKPNAYNKNVTTKKETAVTIKMIRGDYDANASSNKTATVVANPTNGSVGGYREPTDDIIYTPANGFTGEDSFTFTMSDGVNTSEEKTVLIRVTEGASGRLT